MHTYYTLVFFFLITIFIWWAQWGGVGFLPVECPYGDRISVPGRVKPFHFHSPYAVLTLKRPCAALLETLLVTITTWYVLTVTRPDDSFGLSPYLCDRLLQTSRTFEGPAQILSSSLRVDDELARDCNLLIQCRVFHQSVYVIQIVSLRAIELILFALSSACLTMGTDDIHFF